MAQKYTASGAPNWPESDVYSRTVRPVSGHQFQCVVECGHEILGVLETH